PAAESSPALPAAFLRSASFLPERHPAPWSRQFLPLASPSRRLWHPELLRPLSISGATQGLHQAFACPSGGFAHAPPARGFSPRAGLEWRRGVEVKAFLRTR